MQARSEVVPDKLAILVTKLETKYFSHRSEDISVRIRFGWLRTLLIVAKRTESLCWFLSMTFEKYSCLATLTACPFSIFFLPSYRSDEEHECYYY